MTDFFVSYTGIDKGHAEWIAYVLEEEGYSVIIQAWDFRPGNNFVLAMQKAAAEAEHTVMVLSPDYLKSLYAAPEWATAFGDDPTGVRRKVVPVMVRPCTPTGLLAPIVHISLVDLDEDAARAELIAGVQSARAKPSQRPAFPGKAAVEPKAFPDADVEMAPSPRRPLVPGLRAVPSDRERRRFLKRGFETVRKHFEANARQAGQGEPRLQFDVEMESKSDLRAECFLDGSSTARCRIWLGGLSSDNSICYAQGQHFSDTSYNDLLTVEASDTLYFSAMMSMGHSRIEQEFDVKQMNADQAADYLWARFTSTIR